jgi:hypothetical protein
MVPEGVILHYQLLTEETKMTQFYVGVKIIEAWKQEKDGKPGYAVKYQPDGYISWSPQDVFEDAYLPMGLDPSKVNDEMVDSFISEIHSHGLDDGKTVFLSADLITGFVQYETSSCVDPNNFDHEVGKDICLHRVKDTLWKCLGFVVQWGRFGLQAKK